MKSRNSDTHREKIGMGGPLIINPIYTLYQSHIAHIHLSKTAPNKGGLNSLRALHLTGAPTIFPGLMAWIDIWFALVFGVMFFSYPIFLW